MRVYIGFDDTDNIHADRGTGKLARWFEQKLSGSARQWAVVRQQLLVRDDIPYTSHNSSACVVIDMDDPSLLEELTRKAVEHIESLSLEGSDPGLCIAWQNGVSLSRLTQFGVDCTYKKMTQGQAIDAAKPFHLTGHGGTNDGIIGAAAAVGLTANGWHGRMIEFGGLRQFGEKVSVSELANKNIMAMSVDRNAKIPSPDSWILTKSWVRPRLMGNQPVLLVRPGQDGNWVNIDEKRKKKHNEN